MSSNVLLLLCCHQLVTSVLFFVTLYCTYPLVLAELSALVGGGSLGEPAQYHLLLQDLQLVHVHQDLDGKTPCLMNVELHGS